MQPDAAAVEPRRAASLPLPLRAVFRQRGPLIGLIALSIALTLLSDRFLTVSNLLNVGQQIALLAIVAIGQTMVVIAGGIDLSVGSVVALASIVFAITLVGAGSPLPVAILVAILVGTAVGVVNGMLVTYARLPAFIATLATLSIGRGLALVISEGRPISGFPDEFRVLTSGSIAGIPVSVLLMLALYLGAAVLLRQTPFGRSLYAIGGSEEVARLSGVAVKRAKVAVFALAGALAGIGGLVLTSRLNSAQPTAAEGLELDVIAAVVIGGASLNGGQGTVFGTLLGALVIGVLRNGLNLLNVSSFWQQVAVGLVIAAAVMTDTLRRRRA